MTNDSAIAATFSDFKVVKTRSIAQYIFEGPIENADNTLKILGGIPLPGKEKWFGIAPLNEKPVRITKEKTGAELINYIPPEENPKREMTLPQMVGMICADEKFQEFIFSRYAFTYPKGLMPSERSALYVRAICGVKSRSEILPGTDAQKKWAELYNSYAGIRG